MKSIIETHNWSISTPFVASITHSLHLKLIKHHREGGQKSVRARGPGNLLWHNVFCISLMSYIAMKHQQSSHYNKMCTATTPAGMHMWRSKISSWSTSRQWATDNYCLLKKGNQFLQEWTFCYVLQALTRIKYLNNMSSVNLWDGETMVGLDEKEGRIEMT